MRTNRKPTLMSIEDHTMEKISDRQDMSIQLDEMARELEALGANLPR